MTNFRGLAFAAAQAFALAATLTACNLYSPPPAAVTKDNYTTIGKADHKTIPDSMEMMTLDQAQDTALENNPDFKSKYQAISAARAAYYQSFSGYFPTLTASFNGTHSNFNPQYQSGGSPGNGSKTTAYSPSLGANWTIFDSCVREMNLLAAQHNWKESEQLELDARRVLLKSVASAYNNILLAVENERISKADMDFNYTLLKETELKFDAGAVPLSDVLNFKINYNNAENKLIAARYSLDSAKYSLAALMGLTECTLPPSLKFPAIPSAEDTLMDVGVYLDMALASRPDLKAYREALENSRYKYYSSICSFGPVVSATGNVYYQAQTSHSSTVGGSSSGNSNSYQKGWGDSYGAGVSWEVFSGGSTYFAMRQAQANVAQSEFTVASNWINVITEVRQAYDNYNVNVKQARLYKKTLELTIKNRDLVAEQYKAGSAAIELLNQADNNVVTAETNMASALINMQNAKAQLDAATNSK